VERGAPFLLFAMLLLLGALLLYPSLAKEYSHTTVTLQWDARSNSLPIDVTVVQIFEKNYDTVLSELLGETMWREVQTALNAKAGITRLSSGDILSITREGDILRKISLHHYFSRISGEETTLYRMKTGWRMSRRHLVLSEQTMIKTFVVQEDFAHDFPEFYAVIRPFMQWDWGILHRLKPGDAISFMIRGTFDRKILVDLHDLVGFSVKSAQYGTFTLLKPPGCPLCEFYSTSSEFFMSPPGFFRAPINAGRVTSLFGIREDPLHEGYRMHEGVDIKAEAGTLVHAARDGIVEETGPRRGYGITVVIRHDDDLKTIYAHLQTVYVVRGSSVRMGDIIGAVGNTGRSTGSHLHFGVYRGNVAVDPLSFTYERLWLPPFDIAESFQQGTVARVIALEESLRQGRSFFVPETYATLRAHHNP